MYRRNAYFLVEDVFTDTLFSRWFHTNAKQRPNVKNQNDQPIGYKTNLVMYAKIEVSIESINTYEL